MPAELTLVLIVALAAAALVLVTAYRYEHHFRITETARYRAERDEARAAAATDRAALVHVTEQRDTLGDKLTETRKAYTRQADKIKDLERRLANMERVSRSRLYQESMEDQQARIQQATTLLRNAKRDVDDAFRALGQDGVK